MLVLLVGGASGHAPAGSSSVVLAIQQSDYTTEHDNFTVSVQVASTAGIQFAYFTFCQLSSPVCYLPVSMVQQGTNWLVGTTKAMTSYPGMVEGVRAGYNITIVYNDNSNVTEPTVPNPFANLAVTTSVTGEYMFSMTVSPQVYGLTGVVHDAATGAGIAGANVTITPGNLPSTQTSSTGAYSFSGLVNGTYSLSVSEGGYQSATETVAIAGQPVVKDVALANSSTNPNPGGTGLPSEFAGTTLLVIGLLIAAVVTAVAVVMWRRRNRGDRRPPAEGDSSPSGSPPSQRKD